MKAKALACYSASRKLSLVGWCGAVRCGAVWCGVVWCGVVWCGVLPPVDDSAGASPAAAAGAGPAEPGDPAEGPATVRLGGLVLGRPELCLLYTSPSPRD
eukprot:14561447-Alexandrium_andersonii.AAC.1